MTAPGLVRRARDRAQGLCMAAHAALSRLTSGSRLPRGGAVARLALPPPGPDALSAILTRVETALATDVLPFWTRRTWDEGDGGFITHLDRWGERRGVTDKYLVMQARMIWTLAAAHRHGLREAGYLDLAGRGVRFLLERMWDVHHGKPPW